MITLLRYHIPRRPSFSTRYLCISSTPDAHLVKLKVPPIPKDRLQFNLFGEGPNSLVRLRFKPSEADWLPIEILQRFMVLNKDVITDDGYYDIVSSPSRDMQINIDECMVRLSKELEKSSEVPVIPEDEDLKDKKIKKQKIRQKIKRDRNKIHVRDESIP